MMTLFLEQSRQAPRILQQYKATWADYEALRDDDSLEWQKISFHRGWLWIDIGKEGLNHASFSDLMTMLFGFWSFLHPEIRLQSFGRCLIEKPETQACAPDLILYKGEDIPRWQSGELRRIDLSRQRVPDLVGEIADTSLSLDLDEQKRLYASLGIPEYWVIDVKGLRLFAFILNDLGLYEATQISKGLTGLPILLVEQTLERLTTETNTAAANWFMQQVQHSLNSSPDA